MTFTVHGIPVSTHGGVAIGRAVCVVSIRSSTPHYFVTNADVPTELARIQAARDIVLDDMQRLQLSLAEHSHKDAPQELAAIMDVHVMLLQDEMLFAGIEQFIAERHYNAEWALTSQLEILAAQFDDMHDTYMRERKGDLEQVAERLLLQMRGQPRVKNVSAASDVPLVLIAHDLSPSDMLQFKNSAASGVFVGFVTDVGGKTSHTAIVARSMGIPAIVGAKSASALVRQDDWVIVDAAAGVLVVDPSTQVLAQYQLRQKQNLQTQNDSKDFTHAALFAADGSKVEVLANIESPSDAALALAAGAEGIGLFRTEFLFMGRSTLPSEDEQYEAYREVVEVMRGLPVTIRTIDIGADKPLDASHSAAQQQATHLNPALGLRAIRWCLAEPAMFQAQLRALLRAAVHGPIEVLIPMLAHESEIKQCMLHIDRARVQLDAMGIPYGDISVGAMIEVPAAALIVPTFLKYFDFLSIGTNDLIQYTLAVDRADEAVAHLYDANHPAVQFLIESTIKQCVDANKSVSVCGEMAGDENQLQALLAMGLRKFSMHPTQLSSFKRHFNLLEF